MITCKIIVDLKHSMTKMQIKWMVYNILLLVISRHLNNHTTISYLYLITILSNSTAISTYIRIDVGLYPNYSEYYPIFGLYPIFHFKIIANSYLTYKNIRASLKNHHSLFLTQ